MTNDLRMKLKASLCLHKIDWSFSTQKCPDVKLCGATELTRFPNRPTSTAHHGRPYNVIIMNSHWNVACTSKLIIKWRVEVLVIAHLPQRVTFLNRNMSADTARCDNDLMSLLFLDNTRRNSKNTQSSITWEKSSTRSLLKFRCESQNPQKIFARCCSMKSNRFGMKDDLFHWRSRIFLPYRLFIA